MKNPTINVKIIIPVTTEKRTLRRSYSSEICNNSSNFVKPTTQQELVSPLSRQRRHTIDVCVEASDTENEIFTQTSETESSPPPKLHKKYDRSLL